LHLLLLLLLQSPLIPAGFAACVARCPDAPCLVSEDGSSMSFAEVDAAAMQLARRLVARGVGKDRAVGILFDRQPAVVVSMIAVHKVRPQSLPRSQACNFRCQIVTVDSFFGGLHECCDQGRNPETLPYL
jgi:non-ribosomal peptide synthetase component F